MTTWITDFIVYTSNNKDCPDHFNGYEMHLQDLNESHGGKFIYVGRKRERIISENHKNAVTSLRFLAFSDKQIEKPVGWEFWNYHDLSEGAGGKFIYMVWNKGENELNPIIEIDFCVSESKESYERKGISISSSQGYSGVFKKSSLRIVEGTPIFSNSPINKLIKISKKKRPSASKFAEKGKWESLLSDNDPPFYICRPTGKFDIPLTLCHPVFEKFMLDCESTSFDDERKEKIFKLACAMGDTYDSENDREKEFENKLNNFLGYNIDGKDRKKRNCNEEVRFDALVKLEYSKSEKDALLVGFEYKNESSKVDPYVQISTYYQEYVVQHAEDDEDLILNTCLPSENLIVRPDFFESWINQLTRIFCSLHEAIKTLEKYYSECLLVPEKKIDRNVGRFPWIRSYTKDSLVVSFQYKKRCVDILQSLVYLVEKNDDTKHIVKFSGTYGYDAHSFCAEHQIAPKIIHYSDINSGYKFIVMEYLDGYETINSLFSKVKKEDLKEIKNSIKVADRWVIKIIDFEWAGPEGKIRYPYVTMNPKIKWHNEVKPGNLIRKSHDIHLLDEGFITPQ
ncbi:15989_t:CDS:2 [Entrophospora sp. SA101]|nr:15989_t:CDS:2 [Entrophospora sp. SA101]